MSTFKDKSSFDDKYEYIGKDPICQLKLGFLYRVKDKKFGNEYILKKLKKFDPKNPGIEIEAKESFDTELYFLKNVKGNNIINIIDFYENEKDYYYIVLEKMDGDLAQMLTENYKNGMPSNLIRKIFKQLNSGLKIMRAKGICHRDLKPNNILFSYTNEKKNDFIIKLADFDLSTELSSISQTKSIAGTELFKAPEIKKEKYSNKCDLYSLGIILYMLKTGEYIFEGEDLFEILTNKNNNKIKKDTDDEKLNKLIKKLVVINPKERIEWKDYFDDPFFKENDNEKFFNQTKIKKENDKKDEKGNKFNKIIKKRISKKIGTKQKW